MSAVIVVMEGHFVRPKTNPPWGGMLLVKCHPCFPFWDMFWCVFDCLKAVNRIPLLQHKPPMVLCSSGKPPSLLCTNHCTINRWNGQHQRNETNLGWQHGFIILLYLHKMTFWILLDHLNNTVSNMVDMWCWSMYKSYSFGQVWNIYTVTQCGIID